MTSRLDSDLLADVELMRRLHLTHKQVQGLSPVVRGLSLEVLHAIPDTSPPSASAGRIWELLAVTTTLLQAAGLACGWITVVDAVGATITRAPLTGPDLAWWFLGFLTAAMVTGRAARRARRVAAGQPPPYVCTSKEIAMLLPYWARLVVGAVLAALAGYLFDAYVPAQPLAHIVAIALYVIAALAVVLAALNLLLGYTPGRRMPPPG